MDHGAMPLAGHLLEKGHGKDWLRVVLSGATCMSEGHMDEHDDLFVHAPGQGRVAFNIQWHSWEGATHGQVWPHVYRLPMGLRSVSDQYVDHVLMVGP